MKQSLSQTGTIDATALSRRSLLTGGAALMAGFAAPRAAEAQTPSAKGLRRGGSIHTLLNWPELEPGSKDRFKWPPFSAPKYHAALRALPLFRRAGLDFIRLTIDPGPFLATSGAQRDELDAILVSRCKAILDAGLNVIADFHPISQVPAWTPQRILGEAPVFASFAKMIERTARALRGLDGSRLAIEFINEPPTGYDGASAARFHAQMREAHRLARAANQDIAFVITGAAGGSIRGLTEFDPGPFPDKNIYWTFHYYGPHLFTHQGVATSQENMLHFKYLTDLPYPVEKSGAAATEQAIRQAILADRTLPAATRSRFEGAAVKSVQDYFAGGFDARSIAREFDAVSVWAKKHGIPGERILLGEFGAARRSPQGNGALNRHREIWMQDVRTEAEKRGFAWALWDIDSEQMGLVTRRGSGVLDQGVVRALGLNESA